jgi:hypothetical protein
MLQILRQQQQQQQQQQQRLQPTNRSVGTCCNQTVLYQIKPG